MEIFIAIIVAFVIFQLSAVIGAHRQLAVEVECSPQEALRLVESRFSLLWKRAGGDGDLNYRPLFCIFRLPTLSINAIGDGRGGSEVHIWVSEHHGQGIFIQHAPTAWIKKMRLGSILKKV